MLSLLSRFFLIFAAAFWPFDSSSAQLPPEWAAVDLPQNPELYEYVRISLMENTDKIMMETAEPFRILDRNGRLLLEGHSMVSTRVETQGQSIRLGSQIFSSQPITIVSQGEGLKLGERFYRDSIVFWVTKEGKLDIINELEVESYLQGVLPWEVNPEWPIETLKAQAIAARSYALFQMIKNQNSKYDMTKDVASQVYGGKTSEKTRTSEAIAATRGKILTYRGQVLSAYYHSTCGGTTTRADLIWNVRKHPALQGVQCEFCRGTKHYRWQAEFSFQEMENALNRKGWNLSGIRNIDASKRDASGRVKEFIIQDQKGKTAVPSNDFRLALDPFKFKSTLLDGTERRGERLIFSGRGWGHGVGLCQWGSKRLGDLGYDYKQILDYYYPETDIIQYYS